MRSFYPEGGVIMKKIIMIMVLTLLIGAFSQVGNALDFDGIDDFVTVNSSITSATTSQPLTVEAWIYPTNNSDTRVILSKYYGGDSSKSNFIIARNTDQKLLIGGNGTNAIASNATLPLNTWTHVAVVFQSGTNNTKIYINGTHDINGTLNYNSSNSTTTMRLGEFDRIDVYSAYQRWNGMIDEVRVWNAVRTQSEITDNMNIPLTGTETGLVAYYDFNHGIANGSNAGVTQLSDLTGNGWHGTLHNFELTGTTSNWVEGVLSSDPPETPVATEATFIVSGGFRSNWNNSLMASGYRIDVATDSQFQNCLPEYQDRDVFNTTTYDVTGLTPDTDYFYRIRAYNNEGESGNSNVIYVRTAPSGNDVAVSVIDEERYYDWNGSDWGITGRDDYIINENYDIIQLKKYLPSGELSRTYNRQSHGDYFSLIWSYSYDDGHTVSSKLEEKMYLNDNRYRGFLHSYSIGSPGGWYESYHLMLKEYIQDKVVQVYDSLYENDDGTVYNRILKTDMQYDLFGRKTYEFKTEELRYHYWSEFQFERTNWTYGGSIATGITETCVNSVWRDSVKSVQILNSSNKPLVSEKFLFQDGVWNKYQKELIGYDICGNVIEIKTYSYSTSSGKYEYYKRYVADWYSEYLVPPLSGAGTEQDPYLVSTKWDVLKIISSHQIWDAYFIQTADIDLSSSKSGLTPVGSATVPFTGSYDGMGFTINGLFISSPETDKVGYFGNLLNAEIKNLNLVNVNILGKNYVGAIAGYAENTSIVNCSSSGYVTGLDYIGGLAGYSNNGSSITQSYSTVNVTGNDYIGVLAGCNDNNSNISNCYTRGSSIGRRYTAGLLGLNKNSSVVHNSYAAGEVSGSEYYNGGALGYNETGTSAVVQNVLFDSEVSGYGSGQGCIARTTAQMKTLSTYTSRTWDFVGETANGTNDYWNMNGEDNDGYPFLSWQTFVFAAPQNIVIAYTSSEPQLSWTASAGASGYKIYSSEDPYAEFPAGWTLETSISGMNWTDMGATGERKFYVVVAVKNK